MSGTSKIVFKFISDLNPESFSNENTDLYLTIDMDWAPDFVLEYTFDILKRNKVPSTWMVTHETSFLNTLASSELIQLGIHPNFNDLLSGNSHDSKSVEEKLAQLVSILPNAQSVRSHSMTQSSKILDSFVKFGITHDCNHYLPFSSKIVQRPWRIWNGLIKVPFGWEDDLDINITDETFAHSISKSLGLKVFNFHPIHIYLNSNSMHTYEETRRFHQDEEMLSRFRFVGFGAHSFLLQLIKEGNMRCD